MSLTRRMLGLAAMACLAAPAIAAPQHGHPAAPPVHATASPKIPATAAPPTASASHVRPTPPSAAPNPVAAKIAMTPQLNARVTALLPKNMTLAQASSGFRNQGQFIAALHVSRNLGIPFSALKTDMTRKHMSLGQSIQDLRKSSAASREARRAETEANDDLKTSQGGSNR